MKRLLKLDSFLIDEISTSHIDQGGQSQIFIVYNDANQTYVAKVYKFSYSTSNKGGFADEVKVLQILGKHQNIIRMKQFNQKGCFDNGSKQSFKPYLLLEYCQLGNLLDIIFQRNLSEPTARFIFINILEGLNYCHMNSVFHYDIKPANILIREKKGKCLVKIADFGLSSQKDCLFKKGTEGFQNPQMLLQQKSTGVQADMFGLGIVLFNMIRGAMPFNQASLLDKFYNDLNNDRESYWSAFQRESIVFSESLKDLIEGMLVFDVRKRLCTYEQIRSHSWLQGEVSRDKEVLEEISRLKRKQ